MWTSCPHACAMPRFVDAHGRPVRVGDRQRVEVGPQGDPLPTRLRGTRPDVADETAAGQQARFEARGTQPVGEQGGGPHLGAAELRVGVDVAADRDELVAQGVEQRRQLRRADLRGRGAQGGQRGDGDEVGHSRDPSRGWPTSPSAST